MNERKLLQMLQKANDQTIGIDKFQSMTNLSEFDFKSLIGPLLKERSILMKYGEPDNEGFSSCTDYVLTNLGKERLKELTRHERSYRYNEFRAWITLAISIISLIIAIFATVLTIILN